MRINCLSCGHKVDLDDIYEDYEGQVKCFVCEALLEIKTLEGHLKSVKLVHPSSQDVPEEPFDAAVETNRANA